MSPRRNSQHAHETHGAATAGAIVAALSDPPEPGIVAHVSRLLCNRTEAGRAARGGTFLSTVLMCVVVSAPAVAGSPVTAGSPKDLRQSNRAVLPNEGPSHPGPGNAPPATGGESGWGRYRNERGGYELRYPGGWEAVEAKTREGIGAVWADSVLMDGEIQKVTFREEDYQMWQGQFQVCVMANPGQLPLDEWISEHEPTDVTGGSLIQATADTTLGGNPAKLLLIFAFDHEAIEVLYSREGRTYRVSFAGENPNDPEVNSHRALYSRMLSTFRFVE
jgi:hypothetical protein